MPKSKIIKTWRSKDKLHGIDLTTEDGYYTLETHAYSPTNPNARTTSKTFLPKVSQKEALVEYNKYLKQMMDTKTSNVKRKQTTRIKASHKGSSVMDTNSKLAELYPVEAGKKKTPKGKRRSGKQILNGLKSQGKKLIKAETRLKEKMENLKKEHEKLKALNVKHRDRMKKHIAKMKDRKAEKKGTISSTPKVPAQDLSKAKKKA